MPETKEQLIEERDALTAKIKDVNAFISSEEYAKLSENRQEQMIARSNILRAYANNLSDQIEDMED